MRNRNIHANDDTVAAVSTPTGEGGIGIVRLSGKQALSIADKIFSSKDKSKPSSYKSHTIHYGHIIRHPSPVTRHPSSEIIDEVLLTVMRAPGTYTKEDIVEINCHGGIVPLRKTLELVLGSGARLAEPGEFTKRAFINGRIDLAQAEAVLDVIRSKTDSSMKVAIGHLEGEFSSAINAVRKKTLEILSEIEARMDFSEEDIELMPKDKIKAGVKNIQRGIKKMVDDAWKGIILREGMMCVICGKPNAGKSSLMNAFLRRNRVIVTPVPGTTRDAIEEEINLKGIPLRLVDTAGISKARDVVERHGIKKSRSYIKSADIIFFMLDKSLPWSKADKGILNTIKGRNFITVANKSDLPPKLNLEAVKKLTGEDGVIEISLKKKKNIDKLEEALLARIFKGEVLSPESSFVTNLRHKKDLENALKAVNRALSELDKEGALKPEILASELKDVAFHLGSILGESVEPDILDRIFSKFCIGK